LSTIDDNEIFLNFEIKEIYKSTSIQTIANAKICKISLGGKKKKYYLPAC
jgi:hypothetical protein